MGDWAPLAIIFLEIRYTEIGRQLSIGEETEVPEIARAVAITLHSSDGGLELRNPSGQGI
jgi:hypothetical protein